MKYEVIKACVIRGTTHAVGDVINLDGDIVKELMAIGRIVPYAEPAPVFEDRSIGLDEDSAPKKRGRPKKVESEEDAG